MHDGDEPDRYRRVEHGDPDQCQAIVHGGQEQCRMVKQDGIQHCFVHRHLSGCRTPTLEAKHRKFAAGMWSDLVAAEAANPNIKCLRTEIGILRIMLSERLKSCKNNTDLMLHSQNLSELVSKVERTVLACDKIERSLGQVMDQTQVMQMATEILEVVAAALADVEGAEDIYEEIANGIIQRVSAG